MLIALAAFAATFLGGLFALRFKDKLHLVLGFSAGAVIGVAFFDLMPEALELGKGSHEASAITAAIALGFAAFMVLDRFFSLHSHSREEEEHCQNEHHHHAAETGRGSLGAGSLSVHSFLDGLAIGLAFQVSAAVGAIVAVAVLVHDFSDGINTVSIILKNGGKARDAFKWLFVDAIAPVAGVAATFFIHVSESQLSLVLAVFCGFFLYIGASDLLPESHHAHPTLWTTFMSMLGILTLYSAIHFAAI